MLQPSVDNAHSPGFHGAETLRDGLARSLGMEGHDMLVAQIHRWQDAIKGAHRKENLPKAEREKSEAIHRWYWKESQSQSYQAPNWKISPERTWLFREFRSDPYYHLKNLVEVVARHLIEEMLRSQGIDAIVCLTSDSDDVFAGVDIIVEARTPTGKEYRGIDIAISENPLYLEKKQQRTETVCREFNAYKRHGNKTMPREVFSIPPRTMAKFLSGYMEKISLGQTIESTEVLRLFGEAKTRTTATVRETTRAKVCDTIH